MVWLPCSALNTNMKQHTFTLGIEARLVGLRKRRSSSSGASTRLRSLLLLSVLLVLSLVISGCGVQIIDRTPPTPTAAAKRPSTVTTAPNTQETRDLAIAAIDFDPALDTQQVVAGKPYTLLVAVENKGNRTEGPFVVSAHLLSQDRQQTLLSAQRTVETLAAGSVTVVRFPNNTTPPYQRAYILNVQVQPVPREVNTANNKRVLEIQINTSN